MEFRLNTPPLAGPLQGFEEHRDELVRSLGHDAAGVECVAHLAVERVIGRRTERGGIGLRAGDDPGPAGAMEADRTLEGRLVVLYGDCPLIPVELLHDLVDASDRAGAGLGLVTATLEDPSGYGRIVRNSAGDVQRIVEDRDCSDVERGVQEVNPGLYAVQADFLRKAIAQLTPDNAQGQLYLTDVVELAANGGKVVDLGGDMADLTGVNDQRDLALAASTRRRRMA